MSSPESSPVHRPESMSPEVLWHLNRGHVGWEGREERAGTGNEGGALVTGWGEFSWLSQQSKQIEDWNLICCCGKQCKDSVCLSYCSAGKRFGDPGITITNFWLSPAHVCEIYWVVAKWLLGKGKHSPLVLTYEHSDAPDLLSSALTYHLLTCRLKMLRRW